MLSLKAQNHPWSIVPEEHVYLKSKRQWLSLRPRDKVTIVFDDGSALFGVVESNPVEIDGEHWVVVHWYESIYNALHENVLIYTRDENREAMRIDEQKLLRGWDESLEN